ncbi:MAG: ketopantoate reductase family protein [Chakrabartia sp.]
MDKIIIIGAGAMGSFFAARLARAGADVTLVDVDSARRSAIAQHGISLHDTQGDFIVPVRAARAQEVSGPVDLVVLFTKAMHSKVAIQSVAHLAADAAAVLTLQNGLGNAEAIAEVFPAERVLMGVTDWPADFVPPHGVAVHGAGHVWMGCATDGEDQLAHRVIDRLNSAGLAAAYDPQIRAAIWEKAAFNAALNALATLLDVPVGGLDTPEGRRIATAVAEESIAVAAALGIAMDRARLIAKIDFALAQHKAHLPSMLQDRRAGRATEIEAINGAIIEAARRVGLTAPVTATLADLVRMGEPQAEGLDAR